ncbi:hypothetical protein MUO79_04575 [Candidatus Bathyarchaeota archaeon]|nr:hypothetical protein [Candidatus Bathyarchaeota archaeon]
MVINDILKVLYAPHKVFKEIIQNPRYLGAFILLIIFVVAQIGSSYVVASRSYVEQTMPMGDQGDVWTGNATLWQASSGVAITNNYADFINGTYYGSSSVQFAVNNSTNIQMALKDLGGSVNCGADGFKNISLRVKIVTPDVKPENVSLYLYSLSDSNFFYYDLTNAFSSSAMNVWNNITVPVGSGGWLSSNTAASWENITSLRMDFMWSSNSSIDMRIDGLFFRGGFKDPLEIYGTASYLAQSALSGITPFLFEWLLLTALLYVIIKGLKGNVTWRPLMVAVGFALITMVIQALILAVAYTTLPNLYYPLEVLANIPGEFNVAYNAISNEIAFVTLVGSIVQAVVYVWTVALGAIITRNITVQVGEGSLGVQQFGWLKSVLVSGASFLLTILILGFVLGI